MRLTFLLCLSVVFSIVAASPVNMSLVINNGDAYTAVSLVTLSINATNATFCNYSNDGINFSAGDLPPLSSRSWNLSSGDGLKTVFLKCTDSDNSSADVSDSIILDSSSPGLSNHVPANNSLVTQASQEISIMLDDSGSGINSSASIMKLNSSVVSATYSSSSKKLSFLSTLSESDYVVEVIGYDNAGYYNSTNWSFAVDFPPSISSVGPADNSVVLSTSQFSAILSDSGSGINQSTISLSLDGSVLETNTSKFSYNNLTGNVSYSLSSLSDGSHTVVVSVKDNFGTQTSKTWSFKIDSSGPSVISVFPTDKSSVSNPTTCVYAIINDTGAGIDSSSLTLMMNNLQLLTKYDSNSGNFSFCPTTGISAGSYTIDFYGQDNLGNTKEYKWSFTIQSDAPTIEQISPADKSFISDPRPVVSAVLKASGGSKLDNSTIRMLIDGADVSPSFDSSSGKISYQPTSDFYLGSHTIEVSVFSMNANKATKTWQFTYGYPVPASPKTFTVTALNGSAFLNWSSVGNISYYHVYGKTSQFTSVNGLAILQNTSSTFYTHSSVPGDRYYYAVVAVSSYGVPSLPIFAGSCASYSAGKWTEYGCCVDTHCTNNSFCNTTTHTCQVPPSLSSKNVTRDEAKGAIDAAKTAVAAVKNKINVSLAEVYLAKAENSYAMGDYSQAKTWAEGALLSLQSGPVLSASNASLIPKKDAQKPLCGSSFVVSMVLFFIFIKGGVNYGKMF